MPQLLLGILLVGVTLNIIAFGAPIAINWYETSLSSYIQPENWYSYPWNWSGSYIADKWLPSSKPSDQNLHGIVYLGYWAGLLIKALLAMFLNVLTVIIPTALLIIFGIEIKRLLIKVIRKRNPAQH